MEEDRNDLFAANAECPCMRRVQVRNAHCVWPVAVDLRVNAPLQGNQPTWMLNDSAFDVVDEDIFGSNRSFICAGARADEATIAACHSDRNMSEHSDHALQVQHPSQCGSLFAQQRFFAHEKCLLAARGLNVCRHYCDWATPARSMMSP